MYETDSIWWYNHPRHITTDKYDNNAKSWYFRFYDDDDDTMSYEYILSINWTWMGQFKNTTPNIV